MRVTVVGTGYVGLVSGVCLAAKGHDVTCVDINASISDKLNAGEPTIYEEGLTELLGQVLAAGCFRATTDLSAALDKSELVLVAVGTPSENGNIDLHFIRNVSRQIGAYIKHSDRHISIVIKSTVIPGTTDSVVKCEIEQASGKLLGEFGLGMNPEFLREGEAIQDFNEPDRIIIGYEDNATLERLEELYAPWDTDKIYVNTRTAEMIKYANNALLATQISAVNEIANLAAALGGIDVREVVHGVHLDRRWNPMIENRRVMPEILTYLVPGCGFGGSCFPKDVQALRSQGELLGLPMRVMNAVLGVNEAQPNQVVDILIQETGDLAGRNVLLLGLAFKPGTDDVRESASLRITDRLLQTGAEVVAHDPVAISPFRLALGDPGNRVVFVENWNAAIAAADIVIVATKWPVYAAIAQMDLSGKIFFDARRMFEPDDIVGARYLTIGRRISNDVPTAGPVRTMRCHG